MYHWRCWLNKWTSMTGTGEPGGGDPSPWGPLYLGRASPSGTTLYLVPEVASLSRNPCGRWCCLFQELTSSQTWWYIIPAQ